MSEDKSEFDAWAVIDLFGHNRLAGRVTEQSIGGCNFIRVDVPAIPAEDGTTAVQAYTRLFGQGAIYGITIVTEEVARGLAERMMARPIQAYELPALKGPSNRDGHEDYEDDMR